MFGAGIGLPLGVLAACVVLFVPMGMAGWHLSRNKMLFFSGALFITLAVGVHLTPYFPSVTDFVTSVQSVVVFDNREDSCINLVNQVLWVVNPKKNENENDLLPGPGNLNAGVNGNDNGSESVDYEKYWDWENNAKVKACGFQKLSKFDASVLLNGSWVAVAGDSQARLIVQSLIRLLLGSEESIKDDLFKRHSDYNIVIPEIGMKLEFVWAPYVNNLTNMVVGYKQNGSYPDVLVMGAGLWHMLHVTDVFDYGISLKSLRSSITSLLPSLTDLGTDGLNIDSASVRFPHLFWLGMPMLINGMLNTQEKREKMNDEMLHAYDKVLHNSKLLRRSGGPFLLLDIQSLSWNCGPRCTSDGMHYGVVYEAAVHILLNALLIESYQKLGPV